MSDEVDVNAMNSEELSKIEQELGQEIAKVVDKSVSRAMTRLDQLLKPYGIRAQLVLQLGPREQDS
jgi:hypothetical protein